MESTFDVIIIGAGPAGISAALYARRANLSVLVLHAGIGSLEKARKIENYYGFPAGISGEELYRNGISQAENLGIEILKKEATEIRINGDFSFTVSDGKSGFSAKSVVIATGSKKLKPKIRGIEEFEGKGVSYCAVCDAFFYRNKNVAVIGDGKFAVSEAEELSNVAAKVSILTDGKGTGEIEKILEEEKISGKFTLDSRKIKEIKGDENGKVSGIIFEDGSDMNTDGIFVALGKAGAADFAKKLGLALKGDSIGTNEKTETNIPGVFACGDAAGGLLQVSKSVYEGAKAGLQAAEFIRKSRESKQSDGQ